MDDPAITTAQLKLLRAALGLDTYTRTPTRNWLPPNYKDGHEQDIDALVQIDYLKKIDTHGEGGVSIAIVITEAGKQYALAQQEPVPQPTTTRNKNMATRKPKAATPAPEADQDTVTGDLLAGVDTAAPTGTAIAPAAASDVTALAMVTMDPAKYVAQVFQPFRDKFAQFKAVADLIALDDDEYAQLSVQQDALPQNERCKVVLTNVATKDGLEVAIKMRAAFRDEVRLDAEKTRKARKDPMLVIGRLLDSNYKEIETDATKYEDRFDAAIKAEEKRKADEKAAREAAQAARVAAIKVKIDAISALPAKLAGADSVTLHAELEKLANMEPTADEFAEFLGEAALAIDAAGGALAELLQGALKREADEAERIRLQEEERQRLAAQAEAQRIEAERLKSEAAERDRVAAETKRQLDEQAARIAADRLAQEQAAAELQAQQAEQQQAMQAVKAIQALGSTTGNAFSLEQALDAVKAVPEYAAPMGQMVAMAKDMAIAALEPRLAAAQAAEAAPAVQAVEPVVERAADGLIDWDAPVAAAPVPINSTGQYYSTTTFKDNGEPILLNADGSRSIFCDIADDVEPESLPLPECSADDALINAGAVIIPTDSQIIDVVMEHFGMDRDSAMMRLEMMDFTKLRTAQLAA